VDGKFACVVSEGEDDEAEEVDNHGGKSESPTTFLSTVEGISNARKYRMKLHVQSKMMAALSSIDNDYILFSIKVE
jgi:hypothetical protein